MRSLSTLELNWVRNADKSLTVPLVLFQPVDDCGGYYVRPNRSERLIGEAYYSLNKGIIVVSSLWPDNIPAVLAHEWRHHWQWSQGWEYDGIGWNSPDYDHYDQAIRDYFMRSRSESDALWFEMKSAKAEYHDHWLALLHS